MKASQLLAAFAHRPRFWLALQLAAVVAACAWMGLGRTALPPVGDSVSYIAESKLLFAKPLEIAGDAEGGGAASCIAARKTPFQEALTGSRTLGYPLLLRCVACFSPEYRPMPWICFSFLAAAVFFFDASLRRFGASPWMSLAASTALIYAALPVRTPVAQLLTDFCSMLLAVIAVGFLFRLVANRRAPTAWLGLAASLAAAYQVRPAYLFLVPLIPCLGVVFAVVRHTAVGEKLAWKRFFFGLLAAATLPLLAWCSLRLWLVRDFGLVSFGGYNLSGLAVELLDEPTAPCEVSPRFQRLSQAILADRRRLGVSPAFGPGMRVSLRQYEDNFSTNIYQIAKPNVCRLYDADPVVVNRELTAFSREVVALRKGRVLLWAAATFFCAAAKIVCFEWIMPPLLVAAAVSFVVRRRLRGARGGRRRDLVAAARRRAAADPRPAGGFLFPRLHRLDLPVRKLRRLAARRSRGDLLPLAAAAGDRRPVGEDSPPARQGGDLFRILITDASSKHSLPLQRSLRTSVGHRVDRPRRALLPFVQTLRLSRPADPPRSPGRGDPAGELRHDSPRWRAGGGDGRRASSAGGGAPAGGELGGVFRQGRQPRPGRAPRRAHAPDRGDSLARGAVRLRDRLAVRGEAGLRG